MITVTIIVKNAERTLTQVLSSVQNFEEVVLVDTGSTDSTLTIANEFNNVRIFEKAFSGFGELHNYAASLASHDWVLSLDADEVLTQPLQQEILNLALNSACVYSLPFSNYFNNKEIRCAGWHPEKHIRLYNRKKTSFSQDKVHEGVIKQKLIEKSLRHPVKHYPYETIDDFLTKMQRYSTLFAMQNAGKKKSSPLIALYHGLGAFLKCFFLKRGFIGGYEGFLISVYNGHTAFYKYLKLYHLNVKNTRLS